MSSVFTFMAPLFGFFNFFLCFIANLKTKHMVPCSFFIYLYNIYLQRMTFKIFFFIGIMKKKQKQKKNNEEAVLRNTQKNNQD